MKIKSEEERNAFFEKIADTGRQLNAAGVETSKRVISFSEVPLSIMKVYAAKGMLSEEELKVMKEKEALTKYPALRP